MDKSILLDSLISELKAINEIESRRSLINEDIINGTLKFKPLADHKPMLFFELLGGDINDIEKENYADPLDEDDYNEIYSEAEEEVNKSQLILQRKEAELEKLLLAVTTEKER